MDACTKNMISVATRWTLISLTGYACGCLLESVHNHLLCTVDVGGAAIPGWSRFIVETFRSDSALRLAAGWGSSLSSLFAAVNLISGTMLCAMAVRQGHGQDAHSRCSSILGYTLICNLLLFFALAAGLSVPLTSITAIMGVAEGETVPGASAAGNLLGRIGNIAWIPLPAMIFLALRSKMTRRGGP